MKTKLSRKEFLAMASTAAAGTVLAACAIPTPQVVEKEKVVEKVVTQVVEKEKVVEKVATQVVEKEKVVEKKVEVTAVPPKAPSGEVIFWGHDDHPLDLAATGFVQKYPQIKWVSPHPADRGQKLIAAMAAGADCPDLYWAEASEAQAWGCAGLLLDLTEQLRQEKDNYHALKWNETVLPTNKHNVGWPGDISVSGWYYRVDLMEKLGYGKVDFNDIAYDEFAQIAKDLAKQKKYLFLFPKASWYLATNIFNYRLHQLGGSLVNGDDTKITANDEKGQEAMRICKMLWDSGGGIDVEWLGPTYYAAMKADQLIGQFAAAWEGGFWQSNLKPTEGGLGNWRVAKLPKGPGIKYRTGIFGGAQLVCPKCAKNKENAVLYMKYALGGLEGAALCGKWGIIPAYRPYLQSPLFLRSKTPLFGDWPYNEFWAAQEKEMSLEYFRPAGWNETNTAIEQIMPDIMSGKIGIKAGLDEAVKKAQVEFDRVRCKV